MELTDRLCDTRFKVGDTVWSYYIYNRTHRCPSCTQTVLDEKYCKDYFSGTVEEICIYIRQDGIEVNYKVGGDSEHRFGYSGNNLYPTKHAAIKAANIQINERQK